MRSAHVHAAAALHANRVSHGREAWGWRGRSLGYPVTTADATAWLRVVACLSDQIIETFWVGNHIARHLPRSLPRPTLLAAHAWADHPWAYRAELYEYLDSQPVAPQPVLRSDPELPATWWSALRTALHELAAIPTTRVTVHPDFLAWAVPYYLDARIPAAALSPDRWTTAHGDLHYGNLYGPELRIIDWEGWGRAPVGYDAATLLAHSILVPTAAARVTAAFADVLPTPAGHCAQLAVAAEMIHANLGDPTCFTWIECLRRHAMILVQRD
jgi:hypothetical protein